MEELVARTVQVELLGGEVGKDVFLYVEAPKHDGFTIVEGANELPHVVRGVRTVRATDDGVRYLNGRNWVQNIRDMRTLGARELRHLLANPLALTDWSGRIVYFPRTVYRFDATGQLYIECIDWLGAYMKIRLEWLGSGHNWAECEFAVY